MPSAAVHRPGAPALTVTLVLVPGFPLHALALAVDALRIANREALTTVFDWRVASESGAPVPCSAGIAVPVDLPLTAIAVSPVVIVLAAYEPELGAGEATLRWLRRQQRAGAVMGCADTGAIVLARAGLGRNGALSIHPLALAGASEDFRQCAFNADRVTIEPRQISCTGGVATLDMMLALVERHGGRELADRVARMMSHQRPGHVTARASDEAMPAHPLLARCIELMHAHIEEPLRLAELSARCRLPEWTLRRLFARHLHATPAAHYRRIRLARARQLLAYSHLSVAQIAAACGFADTAGFSHAYSREFGRAPSLSRSDDAGLPRR